MELERQSNFQDDQRSTCRSLGSNNHPCSQSRKMSIGVMVDQTVKLRSGDGEEKESALLNTGKVISSRGKQAEEKNKPGMVTLPWQEVSPWISTRSLHQETRTAKPVNFCAKQTSVVRSTNVTQKNFGGADGQMKVHFYANQTSISHSSNGLEKKLDGVTYGRALGKNGPTERVEESQFAATVEVCVPEGGTVKGETDKTAQRSNEDLRMKLWEILGTDRSPNEQNPETPAQTPEVGLENLKPVRHMNLKGNDVVLPEHNSDTRQMLRSNTLPIEQIPVSQSVTIGMGGKKSVGHLNQKGNEDAKLRQLSDTIETDTQSPCQTGTRHATRSSTRRKAFTAVQLKLQHKSNNGGHAQTSLSYRDKYQKNIFSFDDAEGWSKSLCRNVDGSTSMLRRKKNERKSSRLAPWMIYLPKKYNHNMILQVSDRRKTPMSAKRMISHGRIEESHGRIEDSHVPFPQANSTNLQAADMSKTPLPAEKDMNPPANDKRTEPRSERMMSNGRIKNSEDHPSQSGRDTLGGTDRRKTQPPVKMMVFHGNRTDASHNHLEDKRECLQTTGKKTAPSAARAMPCTNGMERSHVCPPQNNGDYLQPKSRFLDDQVHSPPMRKKINQHEKISSPTSPRNTQYQEGLRSPSLKKNDPEHGFNTLTFGRMINQHEKISSPTSPRNAQHQGLRSPSLKKNDLEHGFNTLTFGIKHPFTKYCPGPSSPAREPMNQDVCTSAPSERRLMVEGFCSLSALSASKHGCVLHKQPQSSHDPGDLKRSSIREMFPAMGENGAECQLSQSSSEEWDAASVEEDLPITKGRKPIDKLSPGTGRPEKPSVMNRQNKRLRDEEGFKICENSPTSTPLKGTEENDRVQGPSDQNYEDGLERTVALFALSLERFKSKVKSQTSKKCSQILASVAERTQLQLHNVESQILTDVGKFTNLGKSKRKCLETRFQEQQERLKVIQHRFKEEVDQHLQDSMSTLEELETYKTDLKGAAEKQKSSHQKLLLQVEEAIKAQLGEAERRITTIHKVARNKMLQLKHVINESSNGVFN